MSLKEFFTYLVVSLVGKPVYVTDLHTQLVRVFTDFRIDQLGINLGRKDGFVSQYFLQGFPAASLFQKVAKNGKSVTPDVRGYLGRAAALLSQNPQTGYHSLVFAYGKHFVRRTFLFHSHPYTSRPVRWR